MDSRNQNKNNNYIQGCFSHIQHDLSEFINYLYHYYNLLYSYGFLPLINQPTRVVENNLSDEIYFYFTYLCPPIPSGTGEVFTKFFCQYTRSRIAVNNLLPDKPVSFSRRSLMVT